MAPKKAAVVEAPKSFDYSGLELGMKVLVEYGERWYSCTVTTVSKAKAKAKAPVQVSYVGHDGFDEWVSGDRIRSKALKTVAAGAPKAAAKAAPAEKASKPAAATATQFFDYSGLEPGMRVQAEFEGTWYAAEVLSVSKAKAKAKAPVKVSFAGHTGSDEWVAGDRLRSKAIIASAPVKTAPAKSEPAAKSAAKDKSKAKAALAEKASAPAAATATKLYDYSGLEQGMRLQVESEGTWYAAEVLSVSKAKGKAKAPVKVSYVGHADSDEWVAGDRLRSKALTAKSKDEPKAKNEPKAKSKAKAEAEAEPKAKVKSKANAEAKPTADNKITYDYSGLEKGMTVQVESDGVWYAGEVVTVSKAKAKAKAPVQVSFKGYEGENEWVGGDRLRSKALVKTAAAVAEKKTKNTSEAEAKPKAKAKAKPEATTAKPAAPKEPMTFTYFSVWAKGPAIALALSHAGVEWKGVFQDPGAWGDMKPKTPWGSLPMLEVPGLGTFGHELAILSFIAKISKKVAGFTTKDYMISQQLVSESEEIYDALVRVQPTIMKKKPKEACDAFWSDGDGDKTPLKGFLGMLDKYHAGTGYDAGRFTKSGVTVGECKLFTMLHALKMIKDDVLKEYTALSSFYNRFRELEPTVAMIESGGNMPDKFIQYFIAAE